MLIEALVNKIIKDIQVTTKGARTEQTPIETTQIANENKRVSQSLISKPKKSGRVFPIPVAFIIALLILAIPLFKMVYSEINLLWSQDYLEDEADYEDDEDFLLDEDEEVGID